jgi:hypothetical protein
LSQDIPPSDPVEQDEEETWDTVGVAAERSISPPPTTGWRVPDSAPQGTGADNSQASTREGMMQTWQPFLCQCVVYGLEKMKYSKVFQVKKELQG